MIDRDSAAATESTGARTRALDTGDTADADEVREGVRGQSEHHDN